MRLTRLLLAIIAAVALFLWQTAAAGVSQAHHTKPDVGRTEQQPLTIKVVPNAEELRRDAENRANRMVDLTEKNRASAKEDRNDKITETIGIATVLILVIQALAFLYQAREMRESVREMKAATGIAERAAEMARTSADAAVDANRLNRESLIADHRPWVFVYPDPVLNFNRSATGQWSLTLQAKIDNTGKTPAHNVRLAGRLVALTNLDDLEREHLAYWRAASAISPGPTAQVCFPNYNLPLNGAVQISPQFHDEPLPDIFVLSACVTYAFPQGQSKHITTLLYRVHVLSSDAKLWWKDASHQSLHFNWFKVHPLACGWVAE